MISHKRTNICTSQKYTCIHYKYTYSVNSRQQKQNTCVIFQLLFGLFITVNNLTRGQCLFLLQNAHRKHSIDGRGICLHLQFVNIFTVPVQQFHSTHTPQNPLRHHLTTQNTPKSFDSPLRTKPNYSLPKLTLKIYSKTTTKLTISTPSLSHSA